MISFESDYNNGAHPNVLRRLIETNQLPSASYGYDQWSEQARMLIRKECQAPDADIFFLSGGTQTNATVIDAIIPNYGAVLAPQTAHINVHESGAIEACGHKVIALPSHEGRLIATELEQYLQRFFADPTWEHMAVPKMVYITFPTELGTLYRAQEIDDIYSIAKQYEIPLFIDGARLGYGLASPECDFDLPWLANHCDVFYIGGTKMGALCGEAVVFPKGKAPKGFFTMVKRRGALLAKSRLTGLQFEALFTDGLYFDIAQHAIDKAMQLRQLFLQAGFTLKDSPTNQQFVILENTQMQQLLQHVLFETWEPIDNTHTLCRFVTSWATTDDDLQTLKTALASI